MTVRRRQAERTRDAAQEADEEADPARAVVPERGEERNALHERA
jgi:hypothetical protein